MVVGAQRATEWDAMFSLWGVRDNRKHEREGLEYGRDVHTGQCIIHAIAVTSEAPDVERVRAWVASTLLKVCRGGCWLSSTPDLARHVVPARAPGGGASEQEREREDPFAAGGGLEELVQNLIAYPLAEDAPQWRIHVVGKGIGLQGGALIFQVSHGVADGISLAALLAALVDGPEPRMPQRRPVDGEGGGSSPAAWLRRLAAAAWATLLGVWCLVWACLVRDTPCAIKAPRSRVGCVKAWAVSPPIPLARLSRVGKRTGTTVNDVMMAIVTGALGRYLDHVEGGRPQQPGAARLPRVRAMVAVNLRPVGTVISEIRRGLAASSRGRRRDDREGGGGGGGEHRGCQGAWARWGNLWGPVVVDLPVRHPGGGMGALRSLHARMAREKSSIGPWVLQRANEALGLLIGAERLEMAFRSVGSRISLVYSNVPGPADPVSIAGLRVTHLANIVTGSPHATQWNVLSYAGEVRVATSVASSLVPDAHAMLAGLEGALQDLEVAC